MILLKLGGIDYTPYLEKKEYNIQRERNFTSWIDCNFKEHRSYNVDKVKGTIVLSFVESDGVGTFDSRPITFADFQTHFTEPTALVSVYVLNTGSLTELEFYWKIETTEFVYGETTVNRVTLELESV